MTLLSKINEYKISRLTEVFHICELGTAIAQRQYNIKKRGGAFLRLGHLVVFGDVYYISCETYLIIKELKVQLYPI